MSERLTKRKENGAVVVPFDNMDIVKIAYKLCELEDKIDQGKIVELPCRVGQKVYVLSRYCGAEWKVYEFLVYEYTIYEHNILMRMANSDYNFGASVLEIGVSVFLDRAAAEAKLREMEGDNNE